RLKGVQGIFETRLFGTTRFCLNAIQFAHILLFESLRRRTRAVKGVAFTFQDLGPIAAESVMPDDPKPDLDHEVVQGLRLETVHFSLPLREIRCTARTLMAAFPVGALAAVPATLGVAVD